MRPKVRQTGPLAGAAVSGAPSDRPGKTVTDSLRLRNAPDTARKPAYKFVVCPLMREIRAFRYFWPKCGFDRAQQPPLRHKM